MSVEEMNANQRKLIIKLQRDVTQLTDIYRDKDKRIIELQDELSVAKTNLIRKLDAKDNEIKKLKSEAGIISEHRETIKGMTIQGVAKNKEIEVLKTNGDRWKTLAESLTKRLSPVRNVEAEDIV